MPRNGSGLYVPPPANYPAVSATTITAANRNAIDADIATALTNSIAVNGESVVTADIPFGNNKLTGVKDGTLAKDAANVSQIQNSNAILLATVAGTDTITASLSPALTAYANGQIFTLIPANTNTGAVTININGLGAKALTKNGSTALVAGDLVAGVEYSLQYDGTRFQKVAGSDYAKTGANSDITSLTACTQITATSVTVAADDEVLIKDTSAGGVIKTVTAQSIAALYSGGESSVSTLSGSAILDLGTIPTNAKSVEVLIINASVSSLSSIIVLGGNGATPQTTGYISSVGVITSPETPATQSNTGFQLVGVEASNVYNVGLSFKRVGATNTWLVQVYGAVTLGTHIPYAGGGSVTMTSDLTFIRIANTNAVNFDAGSAQIKWST